MTIDGSILLGARACTSQARFDAIDPVTGEAITPPFASAGKDEVAEACALADEAFQSFNDTAPMARAIFLETIAANIVAIGDALIDRAVQESGLPRGRIEGERGRTVGQLRLFASVVREGSWAQATIDPALPDRQPLPRADLRRRHVALGPVAVFGASNFPLAFSVAGGDTASALAAGCPVVVKGHPAHPGTSELVARAIQAAVQSCGLHEGVFSYLPGPANDLGSALVADPRIKAVGFTGSRSGGLALMRIAANREEPIPVYAEMSSINPVLLFPAALKARGAALAPAYVQSLSLGAGQFCTNPGILIAQEGPDLDAFLAAAADALARSPAQQMLTPGIHRSFEAGVRELADHGSVALVARGEAGQGSYQAQGALFRVDAKRFLADPALSREIFGASSIVVTVTDMAEAADIVAGMEGQLTATVLFDAEDEPALAPLIPALSRKVGRLLANGWPTGVEVGHAMVHGGPFPATSDSRTTSVGALAIDRFLRPVCYQDLPDHLLPPAIQGANPWHLPRRIDGIFELQG